MLDLADELTHWCAEGRDFAVATVTAVRGSAPRQPGAALAVDADGTAVGSVSGGCVEGAVYDLCREALERGEPLTERFGWSDGDAFAVGLTCGGVIDVLVTPVRRDAPWREVCAEALAAAARKERAALVRALHGGALLVRADGTVEGTLGGGPEHDRAAAAEAAALLETGGRTALLDLGCDAPVTVLVEPSGPPPRMVVFGAIDFAAALVRAGKFLGYHVTVCDARPVFATARRFPDADEVVVDWPHRYLDAQAAHGSLDARTVLCVLTHDAKFDVPLLERALRLPVAYVGAMGSRRTHRDRLSRLREAGVDEDGLSRLHSPIGLDLGARTPEETALSIAAEIVAVRRGGSGVPLTGTRAPIHHDGGPPADASGVGREQRKVAV
ncbi:XdhC family protein [Streptomyces sp. ET3-23]|uniref:XdhC family protein n=1 Tax=Streptomyces sp. ET3-23 TaxID=2885643 RepID=UPI001D10630A|nr:XdhC/CoxI family protein [Streptomyces sp. ET3-23]MCC2276802.1 XdhC family protein [Streptomyces sp. ET3-23]